MTIRTIKKFGLFEALSFTIERNIFYRQTMRVIKIRCFPPTELLTRLAPLNFTFTNYSILLS